MSDYLRTVAPAILLALGVLFMTYSFDGHVLVASALLGVFVAEMRRGMSA